jgi:hypothetical protein
VTVAGRPGWWRRPVRWLAFALAIALPPLVVAGLGLRRLKARQRPATLPTLPAQTAMALAEAGLLDGLTATAHWGDLDPSVLPPFMS